LRKLPKVCSISSHDFSSTLILCCLFDFLSFATVAALAIATAQIALLEAELSASQKAYDIAAAAKASGEKSQKSALGKAKKAEKALADANKEQAQREEAVTEHLRTMSAAAEGKYFALSFILTPIALLYLLILFFPFFLYPPLLCRIYWGIFVVFATGR
jgi:Flp pilus assembly protein TadB